MQPATCECHVRLCEAAAVTVVRVACSDAVRCLVSVRAGSETETRHGAKPKAVAKAGLRTPHARPRRLSSRIVRGAPGVSRSYPARLHPPVRRRQQSMTLESTLTQHDGLRAFVHALLPKSCLRHDPNTVRTVDLKTGSHPHSNPC